MKRFIQTAEDAVDVERMPRHIASAAIRKDRSLRPGPGMMERCAEGDLESIAIRDAWRFDLRRAGITARVVTHEEHQRMIERGSVVFGG